MSGREIEIAVRALAASEIARVDRVLPLSRLNEPPDPHSMYLIAWDDDRPIGHAHISWAGTHLGLPEIQDVFVLPASRRRGVATELTRAAEDTARDRGWTSISLSVSEENSGAARLYAQIGYVDAGVAPVRVSGTIMLRGEPFEVDDTLVYLKKAL